MKFIVDSDATSPSRSPFPSPSPAGRSREFRMAPTDRAFGRARCRDRTRAPHREAPSPVAPERSVRRLARGLLRPAETARKFYFRTKKPCRESYLRVRACVRPMRSERATGRAHSLAEGPHPQFSPAGYGMPAAPKHLAHHIILNSFVYAKSVGERLFGVVGDVLRNFADAVTL